MVDLTLHELVFPAEREILHHPVHLLTGTGQLRPGAFIPFCEFGGDPNLLGRHTHLLDFPVCDSFKETILYGQLCYTLDINQFREKQLTTSELEKGLTLILDYNEDKTFSRRDRHQGKQLKEESLTDQMVVFEENDEALIFIGSISNNKSSSKWKIFIKAFFIRELQRFLLRF